MVLIFWWMIPNSLWSALSNLNIYYDFSSFYWEGSHQTCPYSARTKDNHEVLIHLFLQIRCINSNTPHRYYAYPHIFLYFTINWIQVIWMEAGTQSFWKTIRYFMRLYHYFRFSYSILLFIWICHKNFAKLHLLVSSSLKL